MAIEKIEERLGRILSLDRISDWERDELLDNLSGHDGMFAEKLLEQIAVIWPVSPARCFSFLEEIGRVPGRVSPEHMAEWVRGILDAYEAGGLRSSRLFMEDFEKNFVRRIRREGGVLLSEVEGRLLPYVRGLSGRALGIAPSTRVFTDTTTLHLPEEIFIFEEKKRNFLAFKLIATFQWALLENDLYCHNERRLPKMPGAEESAPPREVGPEDIYLDLFSQCFPRRGFILDIYHHLQLTRAVFLLKDNFPGLMADARPLFERLLGKQTASAAGTAGSRPMETVRNWLLSRCAGQKAPALPDGLLRPLTRLQSPDATTMDALEEAAGLYFLLCAESPPREPLPPLIFQGELLPGAAHAARLLRRESNRQRFMKALSLILKPAPPREDAALEKVGEAPSPGDMPEARACAGPAPNSTT